MRTRRFRGKTFDGEWIYGCYQEVEAEGKLYTYIFWQGNTEPVIPESVGQSMGLHDKSGKYVFEGDLMKNNYGKIGVVSFEDGGFALKFKNGSTIFWINQSTCSHHEIIGNIHENIDLIKEKE